MSTAKWASWRDHFATSRKKQLLMKICRKIVMSVDAECEEENAVHQLDLIDCVDFHKKAGGGSSVRPVHSRRQQRSIHICGICIFWATFDWHRLTDHSRTLSPSFFPPHLTTRRSFDTSRFVVVSTDSVDTCAAPRQISGISLRILTTFIHNCKKDTYHGPSGEHPHRR